jgi:hypothetical protein
MIYKYVESGDFAGLSATEANFPLNSGVVSVDPLSSYYGPTSYDAGLTLSHLTAGEFTISSVWHNHGIDSDTVTLSIGNYRKEFEIKRSILQGSRLLLKNSSTLDQLYYFVGTAGFPTVSEEVRLQISNSVINSFPKEYFSNFQVKRTDVGAERYSTLATWDNAPQAYKSIVRWRITPSPLAQTFNTYSFTGGTYTVFPSVRVTSNTGRGEKGYLSGYLSALVIDTGGTGYTAPSISFSGDGTGASAICSATGGQIISASIVSGGTGYTYIVATVTGGSGASITPYLRPNLFNVVERGINYFTAPTLQLTGGSGSGATYSTSASVQVSGKLEDILIIEGGTGYSDSDSVTVTGGTASISLRTTGGRIVGCIFNEGSFSSAPALEITSAGTGASLVPIVSLYSPWRYAFLERGSTCYVIDEMLKGLEYEIQLYCRPENEFENLGTISTIQKMKF